MSKDEDYTPPSWNLQSAVYNLEEAAAWVRKAEVAFRQGIGNDGHDGHEALAALLDQLKSARNLIRGEQAHHARQEAEVRLPDETDAEYLRRNGAWK